MIDIIERLRCNDPYTEPAASRDAMDDAISEITRLRATIDRLRAVAGAVSIESGLTFKDIKKPTAEQYNRYSPDNG